MKRVLCLLVFVVVVAATVKADEKKPSMIQWKAYDCSSPLLLPANHFDVSQFGKGKYRIDGGMSMGHFNNIYIIFQATNSLAPATVAGTVESTFTVKTQTVTWRSFKTVVEGRSVTRKEALMPNILPHEKRGSDSDYIWIRIDADSQQILDQLTPIAEGVIRDAA
jgi:hypothetical protein